MENTYWNRAYTVYDTNLEVGAIMPGGYIIAAVFSTVEEADQVLSRYRADTGRYDVRPSGAAAIAEAAMEIAKRDD